MSLHWTDRLSEHRDGELAPAERAACAAHLAGCDTCRTVLADIELVASAARGTVETLPAADLWPGILARIIPSDAVASSAPYWRERRVSLSLPQLALAASALIAVSAGLVYLALVGAPARSLPAGTPVQAMAEPWLPASDVEPAYFADAQFDRAVADLEELLAGDRDRLDPRTVLVIERSLATIDEAIRQSRAALEADPANPFLNSHLADARRRKLDLLRRATGLAGD